MPIFDILSRELCRELCRMEFGHSLDSDGSPEPSFCEGAADKKNGNRTFGNVRDGAACGE